MLKKLVVGAGVCLLIVCFVIAMQPSGFTVERSIVIAAPAEVLYPHIADLRAMDVWSPWTKLDAKMTTVYEGPASGVGARSAWQGPEMGKGRLRITAATPPQAVEMELEMLEPMAAKNQVRFSLDPTPQGTRVTWHLRGDNDFLGKAFSLFMDTDSMIGGEFAKGLAALKALAEAEAAPRGAG